MNDPNVQRHIELEGAYNFRDLGGYSVGGGRRIAWRKIFRADDLSQLTHADMAKLEGMGIRTYVDFRDKYEKREAPDKIAPGVQRLHHIPIDTSKVLDLFSHDDITDETAERYMMQVYRALAGKYVGEYRRFFACISDYSSPPVVFHCMGGKDRTGAAAALFLSALEVDRERIIQDYLLTAKAVSRRYTEMTTTSAQQVLLSVTRRYLEMMFKVIDADFGGMKTYLELGLQVNRTLLREIYTEPDRGDTRNV